MNCPICAGALSPLSDSRFAFCRADQLVVNQAYKVTEYEQDYFHKEYKQQYGRTYTADRQALLARNRWRYELAKQYFSAATHPQLLEIGSAAGYFLKIMQDEGFVVRGWEISQTMSKYANARGLKTTRQDFLRGAKKQLQKKNAPFDILAMFYVLEHFPEQREAWGFFERLVRPGGFLLLALPSAAGPTFRFHRHDWYETHPTDHAVDYSPAALSRVAARFGFALKAAYSEGKHPGRFPLGGNRLLQKLYLKVLDKAPLSDTIFAILERQA